MQQANIPYSHLLGNAPTIHRPEKPLFRDRYTLLEELGRGTFGTVFRARDTHNQAIVAIKQFRQSGLSPQMRAVGYQCFRSETKLLDNLRHPQIPRLYESFLVGYPSYLAMSYIPGQTLERFIQRFPQGIVPLNITANIVFQLCTVLGYLHTHQPPIKFRDLNPQNVLCTQDGQIFLVDFGSARVFTEGETDPIPLGVKGYAPYEQYAIKGGQGVSTPASDVYSLGVILHQMLTGEDPRVAAASFRFSPLAPFGVPPTLIVLVAYMLSEQQHRPTIQQVGQAISSFI